MPVYDIAGIKATQDENDALNTAIIQRLDQFWNGLIKGLAVFTDAAIEAGVRDVRPCKPRARQPQLRMADVTVNRFNLTLIASDAVWSVEFLRGPIAARIFIYTMDEPDTTPFLDYLVFHEHGERYAVMGRFFGREKTQTFWHGDATTEGGSLAAEILIKYVYGFKNLWQERPPLGVVSANQKGDLGYRVPST
jgi:hypothetical protein